MKQESRKPMAKCVRFRENVSALPERVVNSAWSRTSGRVGLVTVFTALSLGTDYAMVSIPNVKIMDSLVFIAAFLFGLQVGAGVAVLTWTVYGTVNPYGQASPILLGFLMVGETFYALVGVLLRRVKLTNHLLNEKNHLSRFVLPRTSLLFALVGFIATFAYDVLTNFASYLFLSPSLLDALIIGMVTGAPFAIIHEVSNLAFFATVVPLAILAGRRFDRSVR